jgi:hypothetical protein
MHNICLIWAQGLSVFSKMVVLLLNFIRSAVLELELELKLEQCSPLNAPLVVLHPQAYSLLLIPNTAICVSNNKLSFVKLSHEVSNNIPVLPLKSVFVGIL